MFLMDEVTGVEMWQFLAQKVKFLADTVDTGPTQFFFKLTIEQFWIDDCVCMKSHRHFNHHPHQPYITPSKIIAITIP